MRELEISLFGNGRDWFGFDERKYSKAVLDNRKDQ